MGFHSLAKTSTTHTFRLSVRALCTTRSKLQLDKSEPDLHSKSKLSEKTQMSSLPPDIVSLLCGTKHRKNSKHEISLWERIMQYKSGYIEKAILMNEETANDIARSIQVHTRGNKDTVFFDGEGGLCQVASKIEEMNIFKSISVLEKDSSLSALHDYAKSNYLDPETPVHSVNLQAAAAENMRTSHFESPLIKYLPETNENSESEEVPSFSLVATVSHAFIKYLNHRILYRENPFGEFFNSRPEFFFIVPIRTYFHLCISTHEPEPETRRISEQEMRYCVSNRPKTALYNLYHNVLFQTFFDFCLVNILPRSAYYPWKKYESHLDYKTKPGSERAQLVYQANKQNLMMIYVRPRKPEDVEVGNPKYFSYYLFHLLRNKNDFLCQIFEDWGKGWGIVILQCGFKFTSQVRDLEVKQIVDLYKIIIELPDFESSVFVAQAENANCDVAMDDINESDMENYRIMFDRKRSPLNMG